MRVFICWASLTLFLSPALKAEAPIHYPENPEVSENGYHSAVWSAMEIMLGEFDKHRNEIITKEGDATLQKDLTDSPNRGQGMVIARKAVVDALKKGGCPNDYAAQEGLSFTPLMLAVRMQDIPLIDLLLSRGADPNRKENRNLMSEIIDVDISNPEILHLLIKKGWKFDPNSPNGSIRNSFSPSLPLLSAIHSKKVNIVEALLKMGANPWLTESSPERKAKDASVWSDIHSGWNGTDNAFVVCEKLTKDCSPDELQETQAKQAEIRKLLEQYKSKFKK